MNKIQLPNTPVSWGELVDKLTILEIKSNKLLNPKALENVNKEKRLLNNVLANIDKSKEFNELMENLTNINLSLWDIEDRIREKERLKQFDQAFIELARSVYKTNDKRAEIKRNINLLLQSELFEEKSYQKYE